MATKVVEEFWNESRTKQVSIIQHDTDAYKFEIGFWEDHPILDEKVWNVNFGATASFFGTVDLARKEAILKLKSL